MPSDVTWRAQPTVMPSCSDQHQEASASNVQEATTSIVTASQVESGKPKTHSRLSREPLRRASTSKHEQWISKQSHSDERPTQRLRDWRRTHCNRNASGRESALWCKYKQTR